MNDYMESTVVYMHITARWGSDVFRCAVASLHEDVSVRRFARRSVTSSLRRVVGVSYAAYPALLVVKKK